MKKNKFILLLSFLIIVISCFVFYFKSFSIKELSCCPFCNPKVINYQKYYEDEDVLGLCTHKPLFKGHCLILPKRHVERFEDLNEKELNKIFSVIKKTHFAVQKVIDVNSYIILQKNGKDVGQTVPHLHFHYIPNKKSGSSFSFLFKFVIYPFMSKINKDEMHDMTSSISENL